MDKDKSLEFLDKCIEYIENASDEEIDNIRKEYIFQLKRMDEESNILDNYTDEFEIIFDKRGDYSLKKENYYKQNKNFINLDNCRVLVA